MLAPVPKSRIDGRSSFAALEKYLTIEIDADTGEVSSRGEVMISPALLSTETAAAEMKAVAAENTRCKNAVMHLVLSWKEGEKPTSEQWQDAVKHAMDSLKDRDGISMGDHQYMALAHQDTDNFHVHIMANRVHPETYRANSPEWLHKTLDKACREIEASQGWQHSRGLYKWDEDKGKAVAMTREERDMLRDEAQDRGLDRGTAGTGKAANVEIYSDVESLETYCKGQPAKDLSQLLKRDGINWQDLHSSLMKKGLELHRGEKGGYTVSAAGVDGDRIHVKASKVFRTQFAGKEQRAGIEKKLGPWEAPKEFLQHVVKKTQAYNQHREPKRNPQERDERREERAKLREELKSRYKGYRTQHVIKRRTHQEAEREADRERFKELSKTAWERRAELRSMKVAPVARKALLSVAAAEAVQAREMLRAELAEKRQRNQPQDYRAWVTERAQEGDAAAIGQIRGWQYQEGRNGREIERRNAELDQGDSIKATDNDRRDPSDPRIFADAKKSAALRMTWTVDTKTGDVAYAIDGKQAFTDHGQRVSVASAKDSEAVEVGLRLAVQKFGPVVKITGSDEFKSEIIEAALKTGLRVEFASVDMNAELQRRRDELQARSKGGVDGERAKVERATPTPALATPAPTPAKAPEPKKERSQTKTPAVAPEKQKSPGQER